MTCLTFIEARVLTRFSVLSFMKGIMGSMRADVGILFLIRILTAFKRSDGGGACGSISFAMLSLSVVMVKETIEDVFLKRSTSLTTRLDFVII